MSGKWIIITSDSCLKLEEIVSRDLFSLAFTVRSQPVLDQARLNARIHTHNTHKTGKVCVRWIQTQSFPNVINWTKSTNISFFKHTGYIVSPSGLFIIRSGATNLSKLFFTTMYYNKVESLQKCATNMKTQQKRR